MTKVRRSYPPIGSPAFTRALDRAIQDAAQEAIAQHSADGHPVYVVDNDGDICELSAGSSLRKLSPTEIQKLIGEN